jgi:small subunit ribosomal protein S7
MKKNNNIYLSFYLNKLVLKKGKLSKAEFIINKFYLLLVKNLKKDPILVLDKAVQNIMPIFLLSNKKLGKRVIIRPLFILSPFSRRLIGLKWLVESAVKKSGSFLENFVSEVLEAFDNKGSLKKKQQDLNSIVLENRSNLRYRW